MEPQESKRSLQPLPFHREVVTYLKTQESALWKWYSSAGYKEKYAETIKLELLKSTYRLDAMGHESLYTALDEVKRALDITIPVTLYQAQVVDRAHNAGICCLPGEAHIILHGDILSVLSALETKALLGHELSHYRLLSEDDGDHATASRILSAAIDDPRCPPSFEMTAQRLQRYTEIYADRGAMLACNDLHAEISCLVKVSTGITDVNPEAYLAQADEVLSKTSVADRGLTHPECFIRARASKMWWNSEPDTEESVRKMIDGPLSVNTLDLLSQQSMTRLTRQFLAELLQPAWFRTEPVLAHARLFFPDFASVAPEAESVLTHIQSLDPTARDYFCFLLLDFVAADPVLEEVPLARALEVSEKFGGRERFEELANKELKITKKNLNRLRTEGPELLAKVNGAS